MISKSRLLAVGAAPELLAAAYDALTYIEYLGNECSIKHNESGEYVGDSSLCHTLQKAIAKAEGNA